MSPDLLNILFKAVEEKVPAGATARKLARVEVAMAENLSVKQGDTMVYSVSEPIEWASVKKAADAAGVKPVAVLLSQMGKTVKELDINRKLSRPSKKTMFEFKEGVNLGLAVEVIYYH